MVVRASFRPFQIATRSEAFPAGTTAYRPVLRVVLSRQTRTFSLLSAVDSGADLTVFPLAAARALGFDAQAGKSFGPVVIMGQSAPGYVYPVTMIVEDRLRLQCDALFTEATHIPLLGQSGFFDRLDQVTFWPQSQRLEIQCSDGLAVSLP